MLLNNLNEISKLSAVRATTALSKLLSCPIGVDIETIETREIGEIKSIMSPNEKIIGLDISLIGDLHGMSMLIYPEQSALAICDTLFNRKELETTHFSDLERSGLIEVANIVIGNFLSAFAMPLKMGSLMHRTPHFNQVNFLTFIDKMVKFMPKNIKDGLLLEISFRFHNIKIKGIGVFLFNEDELLAVMKKKEAEH